MTLLWQKTSLKTEKDSYFSQNIYFDKIKSFWKLISFCYFCQKKIFPLRAWPIIIPFLCKVGSKKQFLTLIRPGVSLGTSPPPPPPPMKLFKIPFRPDIQLAWHFVTFPKIYLLKILTKIFFKKIGHVILQVYTL